ncbi:MAG TPA: hypothetical protein G4O08_07750 [Anaerolineae bacterium]|nr:hypothetical protein [Anaerolineae bacterium]
MEQTMFDHQGSPIAYSDDKKTIHLYSGKTVAYIEKGSVYAFGSKHLGTLQRGWLWDNNGHCVFFTETATRTGPPRLVMRAKPVKNVKKLQRARGLKQRKPQTPSKRRTWSQHSGLRFFNL